MFGLAGGKELLGLPVFDLTAEMNFECSGIE
jgi:hypothetical protein